MTPTQFSFTDITTKNVAIFAQVFFKAISLNILNTEYYNCYNIYECCRSNQKVSCPGNPSLDMAAFRDKVPGPTGIDEKNSSLVLRADDFITMFGHHVEYYRPIPERVDAINAMLGLSSSIFNHPDLVFGINDVYVKIAGNNFVFAPDPDPETGIEQATVLIPTSMFERCEPASTTYLYFRHNVSPKLVQLYNNTSFCSEGIQNASFHIHAFNEVIYDEALVPDENGYIWAPIETRQAKFYDYLADQIRVRYSVIPRPTEGALNPVVDSYFPAMALGCNFNFANAPKLPKTAVAVSPLIADLLNVPAIDISQLCRILGYTDSDLRSLLQQVRAKQIHLAFAGAGGTGMNTAYWLRQISDYTKVYHPFAKITVFEKETTEFSNIFRFPLSLAQFAECKQDSSKLHLIEPHVNRLSENVSLVSRYLDQSNSYMVNNNTVIYGAPSIAARNFMSSLGKFVCATHADMGCSIWLNPQQDEQLQVETYGMIQLGVFFMNQLRMAIALLELLASDTDLTTADHNYFNYEFDGSFVLSPDRKYQWQLDRVLTTSLPTGGAE